MSTALNGIATDLARGLSIFEIDESLAALVMWPLDAVENVAKQTTLDGVFGLVHAPDQFFDWRFGALGEWRDSYGTVFSNARSAASDWKTVQRRRRSECSRRSGVRA